MINLAIDTQDLSSEFSLTEKDVDDLLQFTVEEVTAAFARQWDNEAKDTLKSTREQYRSAIQVEKRDKHTGVVFLNPAVWIANALEMGVSEFDMKIGFLNSKKVKYDKKGKPYLTIPFRFAIEGSLGESSVFAGVMPTEVYAAVKKNPERPLSLKDIPQQYHIPQSASLRKRLRSVGFDSLDSSIKTTSIYEGLKRNSSGSGYVMFRRVSLNSPTERFNHPGFVARRLADKALNALNVPQRVDVAIDTYLSNLGF